MIVVNHFIKTKSLHSDGRVIKWLNSLSDIGIASCVFSIEDKPSNFTHPQVVNVPIRIFFRRLFPIGRGRLFKIIETFIKGFYIICITKNKNWLFHDNQFYHLILASILLKKVGIKKISLIWDLHELPHEYLLNSSIGRLILKWMFKNCDLILVTNQDRMKYIEQRLEFSLGAEVLRNYPMKKDILFPKFSSDGVSKTKTWIEQGDFALWLGSASLERGFDIFYNWVCDNKLNLVILGDVSSKFEHIKAKENVFVDFVKQSDLSVYIYKAKVSAVFYMPFSPNNWLCEPNRLYQLMAAGVFVIVGDNPPILKETEKYPNKLLINYKDFDLPAFTEIEKHKQISGEAAQNFMVEKGKYWEADFKNLTKSLHILN